MMASRTTRRRSEGRAADAPPGVDPADVDPAPPPFGLPAQVGCRL